MIYTFYSYKGGVGRSMALANVAEILYRKGLSVLMIDFDLEAPGLEQYFFERGTPELQSILCKRGVIDMLLSYKELRDLPILAPRVGLAPVTPAREDGSRAYASDFPYPVEPLSNFISTIYPKTSPDSGELSLITAGRRAKDRVALRNGESQTKDEFAIYADRVRAFAWDDFYLNWDGELFFEWFRQQVSGSADVVLIDSRTGVAEMSGVCTYQLADAVAMFVAPNNQNVDGTQKIAASLVKPELIEEGRKGRELSLMFVPSRVDLGDKTALDGVAMRFMSAVSGLLSPKLLFETDAFVDLKIPYVSYYSFVEEVAVRDPNPNSPAAAEMTKAYEKICYSMAQLEPKGSKMRKRVAAPANFVVNVAEHQNRVIERAFGSLSPAEQEVSRSIFTRLIRLGTPDEAGKDLPRKVKIDDLTPAQIPVLKTLERANLVTESEDAKGAKTVEMSDKDMVDNWRRLRRWVEEDRDFLLWRQETQRLVGAWLENERAESLLLIGNKYSEALKWFPLRQADLNDAELEYVKASVERPERISRRRRMMLVVGLAAALLVASIFIATRNFRKNVLLADDPQTSRALRLALISGAVLKPQPDLSLLLAIESARLAPGEASKSALSTALIQYPRNAVKAHGDASSVSFGPDGRLVLTASSGDTPGARVWRWDADEQWQNLTNISEPTIGSVSAAFSPDSKLVATGDNALYLRLWDPATGKVLARFGGLLSDVTGSITAVAFSRDGSLVAAGTADKLAFIWDVKTRKSVMVLRGKAEWLSAIDFSPDGSLLVTAGSDSSVVVWEVKTGREVTSLRAHTGEVFSARFSPDGKKLVTAGEDASARVWDTSTWESLTELRGHTGAVTAARFSSDGRNVVTASKDTTARVWDADTGKLIATLPVWTGPVNDASFSPDGTFIATAHSDGLVRLWDSPLNNQNKDLKEMTSLACGRLARNLTQQEWSQYMADEPYRETCSSLGTNVRSGSTGSGF